LIAAIVAGLVAAVLTSGDDTPANKPETQGRVTVTAQETVGTTVVTTTVVTTTSASAGGGVSLDEAVQLTDEATRLLEQEQWQDALSTQRKALKTLEGSYTDAFRYEAYAAYNMGKALAELGGCEQALRYLDRSEELQGHRHEIDEARASCEEQD
jgi:hypothetical protein